MEDIVVLSSEKTQSGMTIRVKANNVNGSRLSGPRAIVLESPRCKVDLGTGKTKCCVSSCSTNYLDSVNNSQITFVTFPKDPSRFTEWARAIGRPDLLTYMGKKDATNLLVCSRHFPDNMWVNSNTRLKRLHKNAVPEKATDDDINIISVNTGRDRSPGRKSCLKVRKVASLLTASALRDSICSAEETDSDHMEAPEIIVDSPVPAKARKWPMILPRQTLSANSTAMEKRLFLENKELKGELDKNMDYILNQKTHYEGLLKKEKQKVSELESKVTTLENAQKKLWQTYESQLQTQRSLAKEAEIKEMASKINVLERNNEEFEKQLAEEHETNKQLKEANNQLITLVETLSTREESPSPPRTPPPIELNFTGEKFKDFLDFHLLKEKHLKERVDNLKAELDIQDPREDHKTHLLTLAARHLNHLHLSWLKWVLNSKKNRDEDFEDRLQEFSLSILEVSESAYVICAKAFGLPTLEIAKKWKSNISLARDTTTSSTVNVLYEEGEPFSHTKLIKLDVDSENETETPGKLTNGKSKRRKISFQENAALKRLKDDDDEEEEEGRVSDEDEEIFFTDSEDEDEDEEEDGEVEEELDESEGDEKTETDTKDILYSTIAKKENFNFIMEDVAVDEEEIPSRHRGSGGMGKSMPQLEPESPLTVGGAVPDHKLSSRKKIISSDADLRSGSKVVFRVIES